jgi:ketosteroid isomerase-like protein
MRVWIEPVAKQLDTVVAIGDLYCFDRFAAPAKLWDDLQARFPELLNVAIALYEPEATFAPRPGEEVTGLLETRGALEQFAALEPRLRGEITKVLTAGGVALVQNRWQLEGTQPDGSPIEMGGHSADVLRCAPDGNWRILIDDPWGGG